MASSLKQQLLLWLLVPMLISAPVAAALQYWLVISPAKQEFDHQLGDFAIAMASFLKVEGNNFHFNMTDETEHLLRTDQLDEEFFLDLQGPGCLFRHRPGIVQTTFTRARISVSAVHDNRPVG